jgi:aspartate ammonia-lyase
MGVPVSELAAIVERGQVVAYEGGACLFHESTPRQWLGLVVSGQVEIVRGLHGRQTHLATLTDGALVSESILLDE